MTFMYEDTKTWNPFKGCLFDCVYCKPSFQRQAKRQKHNCLKCYQYLPHFHPERLNKIPKADLVFACGNGDISFASDEVLSKIFHVMKQKKDQTFLLQTKDPLRLDGWWIPGNVIVGTTLETNRSTKGVSKAPLPRARYESLYKMWCRKAVTIEPILDFDFDVLINWLSDLDPEVVWVGYANHTKGLDLDEPCLEKTKVLIAELEKFTDVRLKTLREKTEGVNINEGT